MLTPDEYVAARGCQCPNCNSGFLHSDPNTDGPVADSFTCIVSCLNCGSRWIDCYKLTKYIGFHVKNGS